MTAKKFQSIIWKHYRAHKKEYNFPWRRTRDPYKILVSEIMLQQTQILRVIPKYKKWIRAFPTLQSLAKTPFPKIIALWKGLGYNRRARFLKDTAEKIAKNHGGILPKDPTILQTLPGIGHYTARAVICFAHGACEPFLDTNIRRVFIHSFAKKKARIDDAALLTLIRKVQPKQHTREWYFALMDYGREILGKKRENPNQKSASYKKQSPFKGSRRYVRAKIISLLIHKNPKGLDFTKIKRVVARDRESILYKKEIPLILGALKKEGLIEKKYKKWFIAP